MKNLVAKILDIVLVNKLSSGLLNALYPNHIRAVNYHAIKDMKGLSAQIKYFRKNYSNTSYDDLVLYLNGKQRNRNGIIISFDDGKSSHYQAAKLLEKHGFTGWFFIPVGLIGTKGFLSWNQVKKMADKHVIGCHSYSHQRFYTNLSNMVLEKEIVESMKIMENKLDRMISIFCWVGGEYRTYSRKAAIMINKNYRFAFQTCSFPILPGTSPLTLQRTNIESENSLSLVRFQLSGIMDLFYLPKRLLVENRTIL